MKIDLIRDKFTDDACIGKMYIDGEYHCETLEDKYREVKNKPVESWKVDGKTAIPCAQYDLILDMSTRFHRVMPHILNVPGFNGIRIHCGNDAGDTEGCILVGKDRYNDTIAGCSNVYNSLVEHIKLAIKDGEKVTIQVSNKEVE